MSVIYIGRVASTDGQVTSICQFTCRAIAGPYAPTHTEWIGQTAQGDSARDVKLDSTRAIRSSVRGGARRVDGAQKATYLTPPDVYCKARGYR